MTMEAAQSPDRRRLSPGAAGSNGVPCNHRPAVSGKFLTVADSKLYVNGVTYGTFRPDSEGCEFPGPDRVASDFAMMAANGVNAVRTYTPAPLWLLDAAQAHGLHVMVGLPVERTAAFFDYSNCARSIQAMVRDQVRLCAGHPAVLCFAIGNEIPASVVRWHGARKVERFLEQLYEAAKETDPDALITYVNYPSTEYLQLPFLDLFAFNVYLESKPRFEAYLARLHNIAGDRPVLMAEMGLDSLRHGEQRQAATIAWQLRSALDAGCAGSFVYSWTDEWYRGGGEVEDWRFGVTDRHRSPKPALAAVRAAGAETPFRRDVPWPRVSVVVCSYNGSATIRECCEGLQRLEYPDYEVIVVDDGSRDGTGDIAAEFGWKVIRTPNRGLSSARNTGLRAATGEIVAYIDDDAWPDPHWLNYLALALLDPSGANHAGVGGPNLPPPGDGVIAECVARAPGGPSHVLLSDRRAEHIPGCNMAFRRSHLLSIGGFDPRFRSAGDDVDVCWRLQEKGWTLGFSPAAVVWHHRRRTVRAYLRQQRGYGQAEAMLERKWPEKYNAAGHLTWTGRIYSSPVRLLRWRVGRIYHGVWGLAPFQSLYEPRPNLLESLPLMPEWYLIIAFLSLLSILSLYWRPLGFSLWVLSVTVAAPLVQAGRCAVRGPEPRRRRSRTARLGIWILTACLNLLQPLARLFGRLKHGLTLWRRRCGCGFFLPRRWTADIWCRRSVSAADRLSALESSLRAHGAVPVRGTEYDPWDLEIGSGLMGSARISVAVEPHGDGRQLLRFRCWPEVSRFGAALVLAFGVLAVAALCDGGGWTVRAVLTAIASLLALRTARECAASGSAFHCAVTQMHHMEESRDEHA